MKTPSEEWPVIGSRWDIHGGFYPGKMTCRVMGIVEGYVVARYKGAAPFLLHVNDWHKKFKEHTK